MRPSSSCSPCSHRRCRGRPLRWHGLGRGRCRPVLRLLLHSVLTTGSRSTARRCRDDNRVARRRPRRRRAGGQGAPRVASWRSEHGRSSRSEGFAELAAGRGPTSRLIRIVEREVVRLWRPAPYGSSGPPARHAAPARPRRGDRSSARRRGGGDGAPQRSRDGRLGSRPERSAGWCWIAFEECRESDIPPRPRALAVALVDQLGAILAAATEAP